MKDNLFYRLFAKADLTDTVEPDFKLSPLRRRKIAHDAMEKIKAAEGIEPAPVRVPRRRMLIAAAALLLAVVIPVSAVGISHVLWRPDVGLTDLDGNPVAADAAVYTSAEAVDFGGLRLTYVIWTNTAGGSTLSVWLIGDHDGGLTDLTVAGAGKTCTLTYNGSDGADGHNYICTDFPYAETVTVSSAALGASADFTLTARENSGIFVPEYYGISFELVPDGGAMRVIIIDRGILGEEMSQYAKMRLIQGSDWKFYDAEGTLYETHSGGGGVDDYGRSFMSYILNRAGENYSYYRPEDSTPEELAQIPADAVANADGSYNVMWNDDGSLRFIDPADIKPVNAADIVRVELASMTFRYRFNDDLPAFDLPIPADGETITGDFLAFDMDGFTDHIDSVKREGNTLVLHQAKVALDYTGSIPVSGSEGVQTVSLYDAEGKLLCDMDGWSADDAGEERIITMQFADGMLDKAASAKLSLSGLWIYLDQAWSVDLG